MQAREAKAAKDITDASRKPAPLVIEPGPSRGCRHARTAAMSIARDFLYSFDPVAFAADCGIDLDPWQRKLLTDGGHCATGIRHKIFLMAMLVSESAARASST
jgi:hypothetical protein